MLAAKRSAGVAPEVNFRECVNKTAHSGLETQRRHHQKSKTGVSVVPQKGLMSSKMFKNKYPENTEQSWNFLFACIFGSVQQKSCDLTGRRLWAPWPQWAQRREKRQNTRNKTWSFPVYSVGLTATGISTAFSVSLILIAQLWRKFRWAACLVFWRIMAPRFQ